MINPPSLSPELQNAQDMLDIALIQRNGAANENIQLGMQLKNANRRLAEKDARIAELQAQVKDLMPDIITKTGDHENDATSAVGMPMNGMGR